MISGVILCMAYPGSSRVTVVVDVTPLVFYWHRLLETKIGQSRMTIRTTTKRPPIPPV